MNLQNTLARAVAGGELSPGDLAFLLSLEAPADLEALYHAAYQVKLKYIDNKVRLRGLIEISNICRKNCLYCGIRSGNRKVERFEMSLDEIMEAARHAAEFRYGSVVLQAGERTDPRWIDFVEEAVRDIKSIDGGRLGITLSLGEQSAETYRRWFAAGAHRYLLRIESSDSGLYAKLHPADHRYDERVEALRLLRETGYQVGTGVMIGLPGQTVENLVHDLEFFKRLDVDMIGMGPYLVHHDTPLGQQFPECGSDTARQLERARHVGLVAGPCSILHGINPCWVRGTGARFPRGTGRGPGSGGRPRRSGCRPPRRGGAARPSPVRRPPAT